MLLKLFLMGIIIIFIVIVIYLWINNYNLKTHIEDLRRKNFQLDEDKRMAEYWRDQWYRHYNNLYEIKSSHTFTIDKDVEAAIRYAMINSYPDKGGKQEDFVRFHTLYKKIKNR